jgi:hypothetical protein
MKQLLDEKTLLEILELARDFEQSAREMCEMSTAIAHKYQKQVSKIRQAVAQKQETQAPHFLTGDH